MKKFTKIILVLLVMSLVCITFVAFAGCKEETSLNNVKLNDGVLSWDENSIVGKSVSAYKAFANGVEKRIDLSDNGKRMSIDLSKETAESDTVEVKVQAEGDKVEIDETIILRKLPALQVVVKDGVFDWSESATQYESLGTMIYDVILDGARVSSVNETSYKASTGVTHVIAVRPRVASDGAFYYSDWSAETQATVLTAPIITDVRWSVVRNNAGDIVGKPTAKIVWTSPAVTSQVTYNGTINGIEFTTTEATLDTDTVEGLDVSDGFAITLKAQTTVSGISDSAMSEVRRFISLAAPKNLYISEGILHFDSVKNAASYNINGQGGAVALQGTTDVNYYVLNNAASSYTLTVVARPMEGYECPENPSETLTFNVLGKPSIRYQARSFFIGGNDDNVADYNIRIQKEVKNASGEVELLEVYNEKQGSVRNTIFNQYSFKEAGRYYVSVKSISAGNTFMDSAYSDPYEVIRLDTIPGLTIEEIPAVERARENHSSYLRVVIEKVKENAELVSRYQLFMDNSEVSTSRSLTFDIPAPVTYDEKQYKFSVRTVSDDDGSDKRVVLSSYYSVEFLAAKMNTPRDITLNENGSVSWNMPASQFSYLQANGDVTKYNNNLVDYQIVIANTPYTVDASSNSAPFPDNLGAGRYFVSVYARSAFSKNAISNKNKPVGLKFSVTSDGVTVSKSYDVENAEIDLPEYVEGAGDNIRKYSVIVLSSDYSDSVPMVRLASPVADDVIIRNNTVIWGAVDGASGYIVHYSTTINGVACYGDFETAATTFKLDDLEKSIVDPESGEVRSLLESDAGCAINIVAKGNRGTAYSDGIVYSYDSFKSEDVYVFKLESVTSINVNDDFLTWNAVRNARGYNVYDGEGNTLLANVQAVSYPQINVTDLAGGKDYNITIVALGDGKEYFDSDRSETFTFRKLDAMGSERDMVSETGLLRYGDMYIWEPIPYTTTYTIEVGNTTHSHQWNEPLIEVNGKQYYYYRPTFLNSTDVTVTYWANASNGLVQDWTKYGYDAYEHPVIAGKKNSFTQVVKQLEQPEFVNDIEVPNFTLSSTYHRFYLTANVNDAPVCEIATEDGSVVDKDCTYKFRIGGQSFYVNGKSFTYGEDYVNEIQPGPYTVSIAYGANFFNSDGEYVKDSPFNVTTFSFNFLRGTTGYEVSLTGGGAEAKITLSWDNIQFASGYKYYYVIYEADEEQNKNAVYTSEETSVNEAYFTITLGGDEGVLGVEYDPHAKYFIKAFIVTLGDNVESVTAYDVVETTYNAIS